MDYNDLEQVQNIINSARELRDRNDKGTFWFNSFNKVVNDFQFLYNLLQLYIDWGRYRTGDKQE